MADLFQSKNGEHKIEANLLTADNAEAVSIWCGGVLVTEHDALQHDITFVAINVPTVNGKKRAQEGDWIIKRPAGDFYPVSDQKFKELFDPIV